MSQTKQICAAAVLTALITFSAGAALGSRGTTPTTTGGTYRGQGCDLVGAIATDF